MFKAIWENLKGLYSLLVGLKITGKFFFSPQPMVVYYPREVVEPEILESFRGPLELIGQEENPAVTRCISCMMCTKACPSSCLKVVKGTEGKLPSLWEYDFSLCSLCGTCVDVCPAKALRFSHHVYMVTYTREELQLDLLKRLADKAASKPAPVKKDSAEAAAGPANIEPGQASAVGEA